MRSASSKSLALSTASTGPKISSTAIRWCGSIPLKIAGPRRRTRQRVPAAGARICPGAFGDSEIVHDLRMRCSIDDGTDEIARIFRRPDLESARCFDQTFKRQIVDCFKQNQARRRGALLALITETPIQRCGSCFVEIVVLIDNHRVFAAHFTDHAFDVLLPRLC